MLETHSVAADQPAPDELISFLQALSRTGVTAAGCVTRNHPRTGWFHRSRFNPRREWNKLEAST
jgi:hypothetical protein